MAVPLHILHPAVAPPRVNLRQEMCRHRNGNASPGCPCLHLGSSSACMEVSQEMIAQCECGQRKKSGSACTEFPQLCHSCPASTCSLCLYVGNYSIAICSSLLFYTVPYSMSLHTTTQTYHIYYYLFTGRGPPTQQQSSLCCAALWHRHRHRAQAQAQGQRAQLVGREAQAQAQSTVHAHTHAYIFISFSLYT